MNNIAVVGGGQWGKNHVKTFLSLGVLDSVCELDPQRQAALRQGFPGILFRTFEDILEDLAVEGVVIATPAGSHYGLAKQALAAGKDVLVEKPLALDVAHGQELSELADKTGRILMAGHLLRYHPAMGKLKEIVDDGVLGKLQYIYSNRLNLGRFRTEENILWSFAPHDVSVMLHLLGEVPAAVTAQGGAFLTSHIPDVTVTTLEFKSGVRGHIFVSWLHPYKEHRLIVVGDRGMAVFDDLEPKDKLVVLNHPVVWVDRMPVPRKQEAQPVSYSGEEPLLAECRHFLDCIASRRRPATDGAEALRVLAVLEACQHSIDHEGSRVAFPRSRPKRFSAHETAVIDEPCTIGDGTQIWHFSHVLKHTTIGRNCKIGQNVVIGPKVSIGDGVKIQNNVSVYEGVTLEDHVFCGPSMVFTNVMNPRSEIIRMHELRPTLVKRGATLGANCTIVCGNTIGTYAFVGAGSVVTRDVPDHALVAGVPGRIAGWACRCAMRLNFTPTDIPGLEQARCEGCQTRYTKRGRIVEMQDAAILEAVS